MINPARGAVEMGSSWDTNLHLALENLEWQGVVPEHLTNDPVFVNPEPLATDTDDCPADGCVINVGEYVAEEFWDC
jgi:hypothetical protein